ncbi:TPA: hypothetical protein N0F65_001777, partial [Lagenidium giganteum]
YTQHPPSPAPSPTQPASTIATAGIGPFIAPAIEGFFRSIALGRSRWAANVQQDILRVLTLWFAHGHRSDVHAALVQGFSSVSIETWLIVIPQLIARIHTPYPRIQTQLHRLLRAIGSQHPHALIYPLSVALKSPLQVRQQAAEAIMSTMRRHYVELVDEALLVSRELIRVAILWHEMWHEGLEEASRLYFGEHDVDAMVAVLQPLHQMMENGPETLREVSFQQAFGRDLREAYEWLQRFLNNRKNESDLNRAWDLYYHVFRRINKQLPQLTTLELQYVSPNLLQARNLQLAVPGTYRAGHSIVKIGSFLPTIQVITSKQRPRRITIVGSNGLEYMFLLKGHEDLRQDERVTQLFGLVNALLINDRTTSKKDLQIHRYPVIPLSHNAGIVGWVPHCDTLHQLIRDYREARKILLNIEHRLMLQMAPDYDALTLLQKVEVFEYALENTAGQDLYKVLWLKSDNSEVWLDRRTNYTRSLAVMSMVGYILGLGDRHPSNLMLHRFTGTIVHIDFGDCFEVAMHREKYPEKIPFRLTRMLTNAMEVSGIEGNFRFSCESVMQVLRENRHSLMAMLEAFVHDPLICWRLLAPTNVSPSKAGPSHAGSVAAPMDVPDEMERKQQTGHHGHQHGQHPAHHGGRRRSESITIPESQKQSNGHKQQQEAPLPMKAPTVTTAPPPTPAATRASGSTTAAPTTPTREAASREAQQQKKALEPTETIEEEDDSQKEDSKEQEGQTEEAQEIKTETKIKMPPMSASMAKSRPMAMSVRGRQGGAHLPPRPSTSVSSRPMSMSKSIAFTRKPPPPARSFSNGGGPTLEDDDEEMQKINYRETNLHKEISNLAASVTNVGQGSLSRSFSQTAAEAAAAAALAASEAVGARAQTQSTQSATAPAPPATETKAPPAVPEEMAASGVVRTKARRMSFSQQVAAVAAATASMGAQAQTSGGIGVPTQVAQSQSKSDLHTNRSHRERELVHALGPEGAAAPREALNEKAVAVIRRVQAKLTGRDSEGEKEPLDVSAQVQRLINQAASHENLCQCYIGAPHAVPVPLPDPAPSLDVATATMPARRLQHHSFANLDEVAYAHLHWIVTLDFDTQVLRGEAEYTFSYSSVDVNSPPVVVLDTNHLQVEKAFVDDKPVDFHLEDDYKAFGRALVVPIQPEATKVRVVYTTTAKAAGLQWLPKEQTAGKTHPYLFTQCQAIHARSLVPSPDTPACKFTYTADVTVPSWCTPLLSAIADTSKPVKVQDDKRTVSFRQDVPIPSYLLAIAAGRLESLELGPRSRVWAEPAVVAKAAHEFAQTEQFLQHAEEITGQEYVWKRYDLVCLPPSFPYGGMENPCLTFVTPTLLAGDRSLADVVAHEIAHSWTGNLVTNHSWKDFWLNEGWTMWLERKIMTRIYSDPLAYDLKATIGLRDLVESVEDFGCKHGFTHLVPEVDDVDPDDVFSSIPYEKGFNFLNYLKDVVGGHEVFDKFAKAYIRNFRYKTLTSEDFKQFFIHYFTEIDNKSEEIKEVDWHTWYHTPGMPPVPARFDTTRTALAISLGESMSHNTDSNVWEAIVPSLDLGKWQTTLWLLLLDTLLLNQQEHGAKFTPAHLDALDTFCGNQMTQSRNAEIRFRWYTLSLRAQDDREVANTARFLEEQGRMKFVRQLFRDLCRAAGKPFTVELFDRIKSQYHPIAAKMIQKDLDEHQDDACKAAASIVDAPLSAIKNVASLANSKLTSWIGSPEAAAAAVASAGVVLTAVLVANRR